MDPVYERIRQAVAAAETGERVAVFHYEVLSHAAVLEAVDAGEFCQAVGMQKSYAREFHKMLALAKLIRERGLSLG